MGHFCRNSSQIGNGSSTQQGSRWSKSVVQSFTGGRWLILTPSSSELDRQLARPAHGALRPCHLAGETELGNALQQLLHGYGHLHARQVRADAAMDAEAEGRMSVLLAVDDHFVGIREHLRITVGSGE